MKLEKYTDPALMPAADGKSVEIQVMPVIAAALEQNNGFWSRLFPNEESRELRQSHLALLKTYNASLERALDTYCRANHAAFEHALRSRVLTSIAEMTVDTQVFFQQQQKSLISSLDALASELIADLTQSLARSRENPDPIIRRSQEQRIYARIELFNRTEERLIEQFLSLLDIDFAGSPRK